MITSSLKAPLVLTILSSSIVISLFLKAGFITASVMIFIVYCLFNFNKLSFDQLSDLKLLLFPAIIFILYGVFLVFSSDQQNGINILVRKLPQLFLPLGFLFLNKKITLKQIQLILFVFLICCLICSFYCYFNAVLNIIRNQSLSIDTIDRKYYYFSNAYLVESVNIPPIYLSMYCNFAFMIALNTQLINNKSARIALAVYMGLFVILLASKIGVTTLFILSILWIITQSKSKAQKYIILVSFTVFFAIGIFKLPFLRERFLTTTKFDYAWTYGHLWNSTTLRLAIWSCSAEAIRSHPLLGYGTAGGQIALEHVYRERNFIWGLQESYNPHNEFLSTALDLGLSGFILFCCMLFFPFIKAINQRDLLFASFIVIVVFTFLIETVLLRQKGIVFFSFFYSLLLAYLIINKKDVTINEF